MRAGKLQDTGLELGQRENFQHSDLAKWKGLHGGSELPTPGGMQVEVGQLLARTIVQRISIELAGL